MQNNPSIETLMSRRSIKGYLNKQIEPEELNTILEAGMAAPTGRGNQSPTMVVVQDKNTIERLSKMNAEILKSINIDPFYGAPTVIIVFGNPEHSTWHEDGTLVLGNLMIAAHAIDLGACWIHRAKEMFETPEGKALMKQWGLPDNLIGIGNCIVGYPDPNCPPKPAKPRKDNYVVFAQ